MGAWLWLIVGFLTSAITLHITTLLLLEEPSIVKAIAVAASVWLTETVFVLFHLGGGLLYGVTALVIGCAFIKRLYSVGFAQAVAVFLAHGVVELAIGLLLWFMFPTLVGRIRGPDRAMQAGTGCQACRSWI